MSNTKLWKVLDKTPSILAGKGPPDVLYHYTSQQGLLGIVRGKKLWATHIRYLNDSREFDHAIALTKKQLEKECNSGSNRRSQFAKKALAELDSSLDINTPFTVYVASFSSHGDQLSQWRGYCPRGSGFSLGFNVDSLRVAAEKRSQEFELGFVRCLYDEDEQNALISELISTAQATPADSAIPLFVFLMLRWAPAIKHNGFKEEDEWRLIARGVRSDSLFREGNSLLIPYMEFDITGKGKKGIDCLESVTLGPTPHPELSEQSVRDLLDQYGVNFSAIFRSEIPFRNW